MSTALRHPLTFELDPEHEAHEPPEARGLARDGVRLLVSPGRGAPQHARFHDLASFLRAGDVLVVNTSATIPAALDAELPGGRPVVVHLSGAMPDGSWLVEVRDPDGLGTSRPLRIDSAVDVALEGGGRAHLIEPYADSRRLWFARLDVGGSVLAYADRHGRPIRYRHVPASWPIDAYQSIFSIEPGSAEMPSAARPFTPRVVGDVAGRGVAIAPLRLDTGVSSLEGHERPYPERYVVGPMTASIVNGVRRVGGRVIAVGTTPVRALAAVSDDHGEVHPGRGWTDVVVGPDNPVTAVDGMITGWHEPEASHLMMLEAIAGRDVIDTAYAAALEHGYLWHEFGDSHLILPDQG